MNALITQNLKDLYTTAGWIQALYQRPDTALITDAVNTTIQLHDSSVDGSEIVLLYKLQHLIENLSQRRHCAATDYLLSRIQEIVHGLTDKQPAEVS